VQQYNGVPPFRETHAYINRIISDYNRKKLAQRQPLSKQAEAKAAVPAGKVETIAEKAQAHPAGTD
jgi:hypothetical protein